MYRNFFFLFSSHERRLLFHVAPSQDFLRNTHIEEEDDEDIDDEEECLYSRVPMDEECTYDEMDLK